MGLRQFLEGSRYAVFFWEDDDDCPALRYLESLRDGGQPARQDVTTMQKRIRDLAEHGPPRLSQHGHLLRDGIYELKAPHGARLFWFYEKGRVVVCSHGTHKPKNYNPHIERAKAIRAALQKQRQENSSRPANSRSSKKRKR